MTYLIKLHPKIQRFLDKSDKAISERIMQRLKLLKEEPFRYLEHYASDDCYKFRIGDYRALTDVNQARKIIFIRVLDLRGRIYKRN